MRVPLVKERGHVAPLAAIRSGHRSAGHGHAGCAWACATNSMLFFRNSLITFSKLTTIWAVSTETRCRHMKRRSRSRKVEGDDSVSRLQLSSWWGYQFFGRISIGTPPQVNKRFQLIIHSYLCKVMLKT